MTKNNLKHLLGSQNNPFKDSSGCVSGLFVYLNVAPNSVNWSILLVQTGWAGITHKF